MQKCTAVPNLLSHIVHITVSSISISTVLRGHSLGTTFSYVRCCTIASPVGGAVFVITPPPVPTPLHCISRSKREAKQHRANLLYNHGEADLDGDGEVSSAELATPAKNIASASDERQRAAAEELITNADTNGDGKFSREEFVAAHAARRALRC